MTTSRCGCWSVLLACVYLLSLSIAAHGQTQRSLTDEERQALQQGAQSLEQGVRILADRKVKEAADAAIFQKGLAWALKYDTEFSPTDRASCRRMRSSGVISSMRA